MAEFSGEYRCSVNNRDRISVGADSEANEVVFVTVDSDNMNVIVLTRAEGIEIALGILRTFGVNADAPLGVGDFVRVVSGPSKDCHGKVVRVDASDEHRSLFVESPGVKGGYVSAEHCERITKDEFVKHINTRVEELTN